MIRLILTNQKRFSYSKVRNPFENVIFSFVLKFTIFFRNSRKYNRSVMIFYKLYFIIYLLVNNLVHYTYIQ